MNYIKRFLCWAFLILFSKTQSIFAQLGSAALVFVGFKFGFDFAVAFGVSIVLVEIIVNEQFGVVEVNK